MTNRHLDASRVCFCYWTRWPFRSGNVRSDSDLRDAARAVVQACWKFAAESMAGGVPALFFLLKTAARDANESEALRIEEQAFGAAMAELEASHAGSGTAFEYRYIPVQPVVCVPWELAWKMSRWWERGSVLAFPPMDFVEAIVDEPYRVGSTGSVPQDIMASVRQAAARFHVLLERTAVNRGLTVGGYRTHEVYSDSEQGRGTRLGNTGRRAGLAAKDLIEAALRCCAAGTFEKFQPFAGLLERQPDLRLRSEILAIHKECWSKLHHAGRLAMEPFEATLQLILGALLEGCAVDQVDFGWLLEYGEKPDTAVVEQIKRGLNTIDRLRYAWFR
jgi:hypothetical protein